MTAVLLFWFCVVWLLACNYCVYHVFIVVVCIVYVKHFLICLVHKRCYTNKCTLSLHNNKQNMKFFLSIHEHVTFVHLISQVCKCFNNQPKSCLPCNIFLTSLKLPPCNVPQYIFYNHILLFSNKQFRTSWECT